ncbi:MAG TPA: hypothetical protein VNE62_00575 [Actinomycetota bacterium]|nr:hypothetical protein [Actinomycetota bacterium]
MWRSSAVLLAAWMLASVGFAGQAGAQVAPPTGVDHTVPFTPLQTVFSEDFELGDAGFVGGGNASWQFGDAVSPPTPAVGQGPKLWGTNLAGDYANSECGYIQSPAIDLGAFAGPGTGSTNPRVTTARLAFRHWMHTEPKFDAGLVLGSSDGQSWKPLNAVGGSRAVPYTTARNCLGLGPTDLAFTSASSSAPAADAWSLAEVDVTPYMGGPLYLRWVFASDSSVVKRGWYVDDVSIQLGVGAAISQGIPQQAAVPFTPAATLYAASFENDGDGWVADGTLAWEWGQALTPPEPLPGSLSAWGTRLGGDYGINECSAVTSPGMLLTAPPGLAGAESARMTYSLWRHTQGGYDAAVMQVGTADGRWTPVTPLEGYDRTMISSSTARSCLGVTTTTQRVYSGPTTAPKPDEWMKHTIDLSPFMGQEIKLRMIFASDASTVARGVYLDDVLIQAGAGAVVSPGAEASVCQGAPGWSVTGTNPSWCYGPSPDTNARPSWTTSKAAGKYNSSECSAIESPSVSTSAVPGLGGLTLRFEHTIKTASTDDGGVVQVTGDGGANWVTVAPLGGYPSTLSTSARNCVAPGALTAKGYTTAGGTPEFALAAFQGQDIKVRLLFGSGSASEDVGWMVRGVSLSRGLGSIPLS